MSMSKGIKVQEAQAVGKQQKGKNGRGVHGNRSPVRSLYLEDLILVALDGEPLSAVKRLESLLWCGLSPPFKT